MTGPYRRVAGGIELSLAPWESDALQAVPGLLDSVGATGEDPAADRLDQAPYPDDVEASAEFRRLMVRRIIQAVPPSAAR